MLPVLARRIPRPATQQGIAKCLGNFAVIAKSRRNFGVKNMFSLTQLWRAGPLPMAWGCATLPA